MSMVVNLIIEDDVQLHVIRKIISNKVQQLQIGKILGRRGNIYIKSNLHSFNEAARFSPYVVLTDLDLCECVPLMIKEWIRFNKNPDLLFNIAVREVEAWLIADRHSFANYLGVSIARIQRTVEEIDDPKQYIVSLARRSRKRNIREGIVPEGTAKVGKLFNSLMEKFIREEWNVLDAAHNSPSLNYFIKNLEKIAKK